MALSLKSLEQEIESIKETIKEAIRMGRNPLALFGKLDTLFHNCRKYELEIAELKQSIQRIEDVISDKNVEVK